jgi:hypothetical protein
VSISNGGTTVLSSQAIATVKSWIGAITDIGLVLLALTIVATVLGGNAMPLFGGVQGNLVSLVKDRGSDGLVGLIVLGVIGWLFSHRSVS